MDYKELLALKQRYNAAQAPIIKSNIKRLLSDSHHKHSLLIELLEVSYHTAFAYTNPANTGKPELYNLMIIADYFNIDVDSLFKQ